MSGVRRYGGVASRARRVRLTVMGLDGEDTVRRILASGHRLGRGTARRFTRVYLPSAVVRSHGRGDGKHAWTRPEWVDGVRPSEAHLVGDTQGRRRNGRAGGREGVPGVRAVVRGAGYPVPTGVPPARPAGGGKTSLVCAVAGELRLPIYQLRLSGAGLDDEAFQRLLAATSRRAVVLLEDVDAARGAAVGSRTGRRCTARARRAREGSAADDGRASTPRGV